MHMKLTYNRTIIFIFISFLFVACTKSASEEEYGFSKIYMPQAILKSGGTDNNFPVPSGVDSSTRNYIVDKPGKKVHILLGTYLSGPADGAYAVDVAVNSDTVQQMLSNGTYNPTLYREMPASMYSLPSRIEVGSGKKGGAFNVSLSIDQLKLQEYAGKFLLLAVKIANPTQYELNTSLSTTIIVLNVDALVIGPRKDFVGAQYLKNPGNPFIAADKQPGQTRWGNLKDWTANEAARSHGGFGGFSSDNSGTMNMESGWGSPQILNGKIYQTVNLPAGDYYFDISGGNWAGGENFLKAQDPAYSIVAPGLDTLPDYNAILTTAGIHYQLLVKPPATQPLINFQLDAPGKVTFGVVVNYTQTEQGFKSKQVFLYTFPNHL
ncbi:MAG: DUF5013 domain-containing protein [Chitinophagaceae bacterium]|nr:MAG: DUF5013 domain-containing protein [Chitinophagaceae bacterium]